MICGMKLRAFFVGPFQWRIRDAKWEFEFKPKGFLLADGSNCTQFRVAESCRPGSILQ